MKYSILNLVMAIFVIVVLIFVFYGGYNYGSIEKEKEMINRFEIIKAEELFKEEVVKVWNRK